MLSHSQVQLNLVREGWTFHMTLQNEKERTQIWDLIAVYKDDENEGVKRIDFHLQHPAAHSQSTDNATSSRTSRTGSWQLKQFDGHLLVPSIRQGILRPPRPIEAQAKIVWATTTQQTSVDIELHSDNKAENWPVHCDNDTVNCLQIVSNLATTRTVNMNCVNVSVAIPHLNSHNYGNEYEMRPFAYVINFYVGNGNDS